jgi:type I restriction enzyme M protein
MSVLKAVTKYPFWNSLKFTFESLLNDADNIDSNLEAYLDGYSPNVQEIISKFKLRNQLETMKEAGEHFTPGEIIKLMTHILFLPIKDKINKGTYLYLRPCLW